MKEFFDRLRAEAEQRELPQPAELRARGDRRVARRGAAGAFSLAVVMAGGFIAARPLFHELPRVTADGFASSVAASLPPETIAVPDVRGLSPSEATTVLQQQGFKVQVRAASPPVSGQPQGGKVRLQDPVSAQRIPSETTVTIWVDGPGQTAPVCADTFPKQLPTTLFVKTDNEICFADKDPAAPIGRLPVLCPATVPATESLLEDRRGFSAIFDELISGVHSPTMLDQTISKYKSSGAKDYLAELTRDVGRCQGATQGEARLAFRLVAQTEAEQIGEQSVLISLERRYPEKPETGPQVSNFLVCVVRTGLYVIVVSDRGWQGYPSLRGTVVGTARDMLRRFSASPGPSR